MDEAASWPWRLCWCRGRRRARAGWTQALSVAGGIPIGMNVIDPVVTCDTPSARRPRRLRPGNFKIVIPNILYLL